AAVARGEYIVFLNNDTAVLPGWLEALSGTLRSRRDAGAVGARLIYPDGRLQEAGTIVWQDGEGWNYGKNADREAPEFCYVREVDYCSGACLMVRRNLFEDLGGFDLRYAPAFYEDSDLCFRLREQGFVVLYQPAATIVHHEGATAGTDLATGVKRRQAVNRMRFLERHRPALGAQHPHDSRRVRRARDRRPGLRILVIDHMVPHHDHDSGSVRMAAILRIFSELGHAVTFLPDNLARIEPYTGELQQEGVEVMYGPLSSQQWLKACIADFDVVILCRAHFAAKYLSVVRSAGRRPFTIFDTVDLHHLREERMAVLEGDASLRAAAARTREVEVSVMQACDMVWVTSTHEQQVLSTYSALPPVEVVPNIHEIRNDVAGPGGRRHLLFIGGFRHPPNEDAVVYFVEQVLPLVTKQLRTAQLLVVGSNASPRIQNLASSEVAILGHVSDVAALFDTCRVSVAPLRYGAGVKGKVSQSLAWGLPVVTTPIGAEGLGLVDREHAMIAQDPAEFAERIIELYHDDGLWRKLSENGRRHVQAHFGPDVTRSRLTALLHRASQARMTTAPAISPSRASR
ncbi:MAG: glycosyltransferase, partial [Vicinamibacterales bacterium]